VDIVFWAGVNSSDIEAFLNNLTTAVYNATSNRSSLLVLPGIGYGGGSYDAEFSLVVPSPPLPELYVTVVDDVRPPCLDGGGIINGGGQLCERVRPLVHRHSLYRARSLVFGRCLGRYT
jgi:hypothetical protein